MTPDISAIAQKWADHFYEFPQFKERLVEEIKQACEEATASLRAQLEQRWIPVSERLPQEGALVLTSSNHGYELMRWSDHRWHAGPGLLPDQQVTHWMPLPASPPLAPESPLNGKAQKEDGL